MDARSPFRQCDLYERLGVAACRRVPASQLSTNAFVSVQRIIAVSSVTDPGDAGSWWWGT